MKITKATHSLKPDNIVHKPLVLRTGGMMECGYGYVVGIWSNADRWYEWGVWLSKKGRSWHNSDTKFYWAYNMLNIGHDSGRFAYAAILAAQANGQMVQLLDDEKGHECDRWGTGHYRGPKFNSVQTWFP
ncbi:hypothetical protein [Xenorhabdus thuongxuanensis]|nr:hypothetical protein [Xenorhabdus thuongxuanensis]